ncbi:hypothetical protein QBC38DRAFT_478541 [Podospora fimiseda]|uniref:DNA-directed RNA polymerase n=1 Tax=Podospora fimiseda TaxID=252190 RepID=A0AAN7BPL5_9PEZI|nr:hypothetical protein QBC38DRAFT_478541 [Podospora fimiseda]
MFVVRSGLVRQTAPARRLLLRPITTCSGSSPDARPWRRKDYRALVGFERNLATAQDSHSSTPFETPLPPGMSSPYLNAERPLYELRPLDATSPIMVEDPQEIELPKTRANSQGIPGDVEELLSVFNACIQVGRLNRASLVLKRFATLKALPPQHLMQLHNRYLQARIAQLETEPGVDNAEEIHRWFESQIVGKGGLTPDPQTIAYMIKAALLTAHDKKRTKLITRYVSLMPQQTAMEALAWELDDEVLSAEDLASISEICPDLVVPEDISTLFDAAQVGEVDADIDGLPVEMEEISSQERWNSSSVSSSSGSSVPPVLPTPQKGVGLETLRQSLSLFDDIPEGRDIASLPLRERREVQARLEKDCVDAAITRWRDENESLNKLGLNSALPTLGSKLSEWHSELERYLEKEFDMIAEAELAEKKSLDDTSRCLYGPHMMQSTPSRLAAVTILSVLSQLSMMGAGRPLPLAHLVTAVARVAEEDIRTKLMAEAMPALKKKQDQKETKLLLRQSLSKAKKRKEAAASAEQAYLPMEPWERTWPVTVRTKVGAVLVMGLMESAKITIVREHPETKELVSQSQPAFSHTIQLKKGKKVGALLPNKALVDLLRKEPRAEVLARHLPMVVEPEPWTKFDKGGFLEHSSPFVRLKGGERDQKIYAEAAIARGDMEQMFRGLDVLGKTAWKINRAVFDVMLEAWNSGKELANFPPLNPEIPVPPEPESTDDPMKRRAWIRAVKAAENDKSGMHSVRCFMNFQLEIARAFRDQTFYFPHNIDFRGRAYPIPTYLNHMGADHMRGVLLFAKGKELGESGLRWLKVHTSNVFGFDKASLQEREDFTTQNLENIFDSAENPLGGKRWWLTAEDPWQCLAACFELKAAYSLPDPTKYVSYLPVHQDGTCNGLQHYAALGGDTWGAQQVNLLPGERPADVYSAVADLVKEGIAKDLKLGNEFAKALDGKITRKVVKQTVMTNVYGVTFVGAKKQVLKQLDALYPELSAQCGIDTMLLASYIATKIFGGLSTMFRGAHDIQTWLGEVGGRVCRSLTPEQLDRIAQDPSCMRINKSSRKNPATETEELTSMFRSTLVWTTPLRMPVCQPYRSSSTRTVTTCLQNLILTDDSRTDPVNRRKQLQAFPPNFIHSLDASHMMLSALECHAHGLTFAAVHDSFWTHAADVDVMNDALRDAFIRMHSEDIVGRLKAEFETRYRGCLYLAKTTAKSELGKQITALRKAKQNKTPGLKEELLQEKLRQDLLRSADPEEVKRGKEMITPASLFEVIGEEDLMTSIEPEEEAEEAPAIAAEVDDLDGGLDSLEDAEVKEPSLAETIQEKHTTRLRELQGSNYFKMELEGKQRKPPARARAAELSFWLPLTFPALPKKGDFDVKQLKKSKYFFS